MASALPRPVQLKLEQALAQWRHWQLPEPLPGRPEGQATLGQGISNFSVKVAIAEKHFVVRIDGIVPAHHGINRQLEWRALANAAEAGLAPAPRYFNPDLGVLVCDYLEPDVDQTQDPVEIAGLARAIHALPALHHRLDPAERIHRYEKHCQDLGGPTRDRLLRSGKRIHGLLDLISRDDSKRVCCHNDLLAANRLRSAGSLFALDWEYCAMGSPWFELAVVACGDNYGDSEIETLAHAYLQRQPVAAELDLFARYRLIYRYLELLWYLAQPGESSLSEEQLGEKYLVLEEGLGASD